MNSPKKPSSILSSFRRGTQTLRSSLAIYFLPICVIPSLVLSFYVTRLLEENAREDLLKQVLSEKTGILSEIDSLERDLIEKTKKIAKELEIKKNLKIKKDQKTISYSLEPAPHHTLRLYSLEGKYLTGKKSKKKTTLETIPYLPKENVRRVLVEGQSLNRYFPAKSNGFVLAARVLVKTGGTPTAILEQEIWFDHTQLLDLKNKRGVDLAFLNRSFSSVLASFALPQEILQEISLQAFRNRSVGTHTPSYVDLGDSRFAVFFFDFPAPYEKMPQWGYLALFLSMTTLDTTLHKLKFAILSLTLFLVLAMALLILIFSNRVVRPIEALVTAMNQVRTGHVEQIPNIESTYEIEYLVHCYNEMVEKVNAAKKDLEEKVEELRKANMEIKETQTTLVQSAKMISLGQLVAGIAHELNNPIGFIYSNMVHMQEYILKLQEWVYEIKILESKLSEVERKEFQEKKAKWEIDFILKDLEELTQSCREGATRTRDIVVGLRNFSRLEQSAFQVADLHEGIRSTLRLLVSELKGRIHVHEEYGLIPKIECNLSQLNQVFMNLLSNAAQAIAGKGEIWIRTHFDFTEDQVIIEIEDNGPGIPQEELGKVFDPFFTTKEIGLGTGLGLSIAYGIIQKHKGSIFVKSEPGKGALFTIHLPAKQNIAKSP